MTVPIKQKQLKKMSAKPLSLRELERRLPHDERLPKRRPGSREKHLVIAGVIITIILAVAFLLYTLHLLPWQLEKEDAAVVNGQRISVSEVNNNYNTLPSQLKTQFTKQQFLNETIIPQTLLLQEAAKQDISASDEEVALVLQDILESQKFTMDELGSRLQSMGLTQDIFSDIIRKRLIITKFINVTMSQPVITDEEVSSFFETNKAYLTTTYGNLTFADVQEPIRSYLETQKQQLEVLAYVAGLRAKATIILNDGALNE